METISTPGWHTVRLITDPDNTVDESDENNNVWERQFYWESSGPLVYSAHTVDDDNNGDSSGNGDGIVNCGETIELYVDLYNQGNNTAIGVNATISTSDSYVTWLDNTDSDYPDIPGGGTGTNSNDFDFAVDPCTPDGHVITFCLDPITASNGGPWSDCFDVPVTCVNNPPSTPSNPSPTDGAANQDINVELSWTGGDPDPCDTVTYDVYFGADDSTPDDLFCDDVSTPVCDPGTLAYGTHYYWYVVATDNHGASTTGDTWHFTTNSPANTPTATPTGTPSPTPADAGKLPWRCGDQMQVTQNRDNPSGNHQDYDKWAWDFGNGSLGWPIYAARDGIVGIVETGYENGSARPNRVVVDHGDGETAGLYLHLAKEVPPGLAVGDRVLAGLTVIGYADTTGRANGVPHLHYAVQEWDSSLNGQSGEWWQWSMESLFSDPNVPGGNPTTTGGPNGDGWYPSGNCPAVDAPRLTLALGDMRKNRVVTIHLGRTSGLGQLLPPIFTSSASTDAEGNVTFTLSGVAPGTYNLFIKPNGWVRKKVENVTITSGANAFDCQTSCGGWAPGDINEDNKVNEIDLGLLVADFCPDCPPTSGKPSDLDGDGLVDASDLGPLIAGYFAEGAILPSGSSFYSLSESPLQGELALTLSQGTAYASGGSAQNNIFEVGDVITLALGFDTVGLPMAGADVLIDYDHCALELLEDQIADSDIFATTNSISRTGTFEYEADKYDGINPTSPVSGTGYLVNIPFRIVAGVPGSTTVAIRFKPGDTADSNMNEDSTNQEFLGHVTNFVLSPSGTPQRPARSAQVTNPESGETVNQNAIFLEVWADDPCNGIRQVTFYVFYDGQWHEVGTDIDGADGWAAYWDASQVSDQSIKIKAFASDMAGNGVETLINDNILLDRGPPSVTNLVFDPVSAKPGEPVTVTVYASDNLAGIGRIDVYVDPSTDGSTPWGSWNLVGSVLGASGSLVWDTTGYTPGLHRVVLVLEDMADNQVYWPLPGEEPLAYLLHRPTPTINIYLPIIQKAWP